MIKQLSTAIVLSAAVAGNALAEDSMNNLEIAHTAYTAGQIDIRYAHLALAVSESQPIRQFAQTMIRDHTAVNEAAGALIAKLDVVPQDNPLSQSLIQGARDKRAEFMQLGGAEIDCAYATNELAYHRLVNKTVAETFIPAVTVEPLRDLLSDALETFRVHEAHAETMVSDLGCNA